MKYYKIALPLIVCVLCVTAFLAGCSVNAPVLQVNGYNVSWNAVDRASGYEVNVDGVTFNTQDTQVNLITYLQKGSISSVKVKALTNSFFYSSSVYSNSVSINTSAYRLATPLNFVLEQDENEFVFTWDSVENADNYCLRIVDDNNQEQFFYTSKTSLDVTGKLKKYGNLSATVFAYNENIAEYAPSEYSATIEFVNPTLLDTPENTKLVAQNNNLVYSWNSVEDAVGYNVSVLDGKTYFTETNSITLNLNLMSGEAAFVNVQAVSGNTDIQLNSPYSDMSAYYTNASQASYTGKNYTFGEETFDFVADSYDELETIVHFGLYYRIDKINYFVNYKGFSAGSAFSRGDAVNAIESYMEIKYVQYNTQQVRNDYGMYTLEIIDYLHPIYPTDIAEQEILITQEQSVSPTSYTDTPRADDFDDFKINNRTMTMMVYNSDQLYYAVEHGCKPIFPDGNSPAETAYETTKNILRDIIDDSMTDYEKALAIYDWISFNVTYDFNLTNFVDSISVQQAYYYRAFYIEGVLFDNGIAVCDGIAKTYALMCGIEDIECYKVTGTVTGGGHAWNKIKLDMNGDGETEWYCVDATSTWGDIVDTQSEQSIYTEYLSHRMFLKTDAYLKAYTHNEDSPLTDTANTEWDYYENTLYDGEHSLYINNIIDLEIMQMYIADNNLESFEFKSNLSYNAVRQMFSGRPEFADYTLLAQNDIYILFR